MKKPLIIIILFSLLLTKCTEEMKLVIDETPPDEVTNLSYELLDLDIKVSWENPSDEDLRAINIVLENNSSQAVIEKWIMSDSTSVVFESVISGDYTILIKAMDKNENVSDGVRSDNFDFESAAPLNLGNVQYQIKYNTIRLTWGAIIPSMNIDKILISWLDNSMELASTETEFLVTELPDGENYIHYQTKSIDGYVSALNTSPAQVIDFPFVRVTGNGHDFYIAKYETTALDFDTFLNNRGVIDDGLYNGKVVIINNGWWAGYDAGTSTWSHGWGEESPAIWVTWEGARIYSEEVWEGRLPTEEEWLYAAQGGELSQGFAYAGSDNIDDVAQYLYVDGTKLFPVGQKQPNELGIYDMSGNATEYIQETSSGNVQTLGGCTNTSYHATLPLTDPATLKTWGFNTESSSYFNGFRVVIETSTIHGE
ncbi:MAG: SUMF1/EgtB/PvdO family nonheme iron enzyme [Bacteroidales bacterium]|nr:SUMF1/EgtB/PvdO family nonheme iron enzyme [Bacteroidales bacterium]